MDTVTVETLEDIAPLIKEYLLPEIHDSVETCVSSFKADAFNDSWTFGTHLWKNTWNRFKSVAGFEDCPFEEYGKGNEYKLKIGPFILRHHRIDKESRLPTGAKAVKTSAAVQLSLLTLLCDQIDDIRPSIDNIIIAIDADTGKGLREVFLGELLPCSIESKKYRWINKVPIYLAEGEEASIEEFVHIPDTKPLAPVENVPEVTMRLVKTNIDKKKASSDSDK